MKLIKSENLDLSLNKYQSILSKLQEETKLKFSKKPLKIEENTQKTPESDLKSSILTHTLDYPLSEFQSSNIKLEATASSSFRNEMSLRLELLDQRKKLIFEQKLNEELSNEFSEDSAKKTNREYIQIQDILEKKSSNFNKFHSKIQEKSKENSNELSNQSQSNKQKNIDFEKPRKNEYFPSKNLNEQFKKLNEDFSLDFHDILTHPSAISFLSKLQSNYDDFLSFDRFFYFLMQEMEISLNYDENEEKELFLALQDVLTTEKSSQISLNALQILTRDKGLFESVADLVVEIKNSLKIRKSEEINKIVFEEINIIKSLLDEKNRELNEREDRIREWERGVAEKEEGVAELIESFERECEGKMESFCKEQLSVLNKRYFFNKNHIFLDFF